MNSTEDWIDHEDADVRRVGYQLEIAKTYMDLDATRRRAFVTEAVRDARRGGVMARGSEAWQSGWDLAGTWPSPSPELADELARILLATPDEIAAMP